MTDPATMPETVASPVLNQGPDHWLSEAWQLLNQQPVTWVAGAFVGSMFMLLVYAASTFVDCIPLGALTPTFWSRFPHGFERSPSWMPIYRLAVHLATHFVLCFFVAGGLKAAISAVRRQPIRFSQLFSGGSRMWALFWYSLPLSVVYDLVFQATELFMLKHFALFGWWYYAMPFLLALAYGFVTIFLTPGQVYVVDGLGVAAAWKRTYEASKRYTSRLLGIAAIFSLLELFCYLTCGLGFLIVVPLSFIVAILIGRDLAGFPFPTPVMTMATGPVHHGAWPPPPAPLPSAEPAAPHVADDASRDDPEPSPTPDQPS